MRLGTVGSLTARRAYTESALDRAGSSVVEFNLTTTSLDLDDYHFVCGVIEGDLGALVERRAEPFADPLRPRLRKAQASHEAPGGSAGSNLAGVSVSAARTREVAAVPEAREAARGERRRGTDDSRTAPRLASRAARKVAAEPAERPRLIADREARPARIGAVALGFSNVEAKRYRSERADLVRGAASARRAAASARRTHASVRRAAASARRTSVRRTRWKLSGRTPGVATRSTRSLRYRLPAAARKPHHADRD
jgi:hypothetical protein